MARPLLDDECKLQYIKIGLNKRIYQDLEQLSLSTGLSIPLLIRLTVMSASQQYQKISHDVLEATSSEFSKVVNIIKTHDEKSLKDLILLETYKKYMGSNQCSFDGYLDVTCKKIEGKQKRAKDLTAQPIQLIQELLTNHDLLLNKYITACFYTRSLHDQGRKLCKKVGVKYLTVKEKQKVSDEYESQMKPILEALQTPRGIEITQGDLNGYLTQLETEYDNQDVKSVTFGSVLKQILIDLRPDDYLSLKALNFD